MSKIVLLDSDTFPEWVKPHPAAHWARDWWQAYATTDATMVVERLQSAQVAITNKVNITAEMIAALPALQMIAIAATGYNHVDIAAARERGIVVSNVQNYAETSVVEHALALMFALSRDLKTYDQLIQAGQWQQSSQFCLFHQPIYDLSGQTLGIIGRGSLGRSLAQKAEALGMRVHFSARVEASEAEAAEQGRVTLETLLASSNVISIHCPLLPETRGLLGATEFAKMQRKPIIINTARGGIVDEQAAVNAIQSGQIKGLGFDVLSSEPPSDDNPILSIAHLPNVILTPHTAWASNGAIEETWRQVVENIDAFLAGEPTRQIA